MDDIVPDRAGIVLAGGQSRRMGQSKLSLPFGPEEMLQRVVRILGSVVRPVVIAAQPGQQFAALPPWVCLAYDRHERLGPLQGIGTGLEALQGVAAAAFVTACDVPLLEPGFVRRMLDLSAGFDVAVPCVHGWDEPLAAVYRTAVLPSIEELLAGGERRIVPLFDRVRTRRESFT